MDHTFTRRSLLEWLLLIVEAGAVLRMQGSSPHPSRGRGLDKRLAMYANGIDMNVNINIIIHVYDVSNGAVLPISK